MRRKSTMEVLCSNFCFDQSVLTYLHAFILFDLLCMTGTPYHSDSTASRLLSEVKHCRATLVLRWGTTLESLVLFFCSILLSIHCRFQLQPRPFYFPFARLHCRLGLLCGNVMYFHSCTCNVPRNLEKLSRIRIRICVCICLQPMSADRSHSPSLSPLLRAEQPWNLSSRSVSSPPGKSKSVIPQPV